MDDGQRRRAVVVCDVGCLEDPDLAAVELLARLTLVARRLGCSVRVERPSPELRELLALTGLDEVLLADPGPGLEPGREPEEREQSVGVEEGVEPDDEPV